jgi:hypothetical protein
LLPKSFKIQIGPFAKARQRKSFLFPLALLLSVFAFAPVPVAAVNCTTQAQMTPLDRDSLIAAANPLAAAVVAQNFDLLQASLLPAVIPDWEGIRSVAQGAKAELQGGELHWRNAYLLDASDLKAPADTQFFCTNADNSVTVTVNLHSLPAGRYALMLGDFPGAPLAGQLALILGYDSKWKLGGLFVREGALDGHDDVWYWTHAREATKKNASSSSWSAWFTYDAARWLALPVDFLSSPNLEKLNREQGMLKSPSDGLPMTVNPTAAVDAGKSWKITALRFDTTLHTPDIALTYEGTGLTDPAAARHEAIAVMSGLLHDHPELRDSFHGLWAYAEKDGKQSFAIELAMHDIP